MNSLFRVEANLPLLRKYKGKLPHLLVSKWDIAKLQQQMMHMYIHDTLIPNMLEGIFNGTTKVNILEN